MAIEYRWAQVENDRLPELAADLVRRQVAVIVTPGRSLRRLRPRRRPATIPIVFTTGADPVELVSSPALAGRAATSPASVYWRGVGANGWSCCTSWCRQPSRIAVLVNPNNPFITEAYCHEKCRRRLRRSDCKSKSSTPAPLARSMRPLRRLWQSGPTPS